MTVCPLLPDHLWPGALERSAGALWKQIGLWTGVRVGEAGSCTSCVLEIAASPKQLYWRLLLCFTSLTLSGESWAGSRAHRGLCVFLQVLVFIWIRVGGLRSLFLSCFPTYVPNILKTKRKDFVLLWEKSKKSVVMFLLELGKGFKLSMWKCLENKEK